MYAAVAPFRLQPGKIEEAVRIYRESVVPVLKEHKGFKSALVLTDAQTNKGYSIVHWETEADARAFETSGTYQAQVAKFAAILAERPVREIYEISIQM